MNIDNDYTILPAGDMLALLAVHYDTQDAIDISIERVLATAIPKDPTAYEALWYIDSTGWISHWPAGHCQSYLCTIATPADIERAARHWITLTSKTLGDCSGLEPWADLSDMWADQ